MGDLEQAAPTYISVSGLKHLGWTDASIRRFLGEPDNTARNPHYRTAAPMKLFLRARALALMETQEWLEWYTKSLARRQRQSKISTEAAERRRQQLITEEIAKLEFEPPKVTSVRELHQQAIAHWASQKGWRKEMRGDYSGFDIPKVDQVDAETLKRWTLNMLRHGQSNYDSILWGLAGKVGHQEAYDAVREAIDEKALDWLRSLEAPDT